MTGRSTSWFDRDELKALFKGVRPARPREPASEAEETPPSHEAREPLPVGRARSPSRPPPVAPPRRSAAAEASFEPPTRRRPTQRPPTAAPVPSRARDKAGRRREDRRESPPPRLRGGRRPRLRGRHPAVRAAEPPAAAPRAAPVARPGRLAATDPASESLWRQSEALLTSPAGRPRPGPRGAALGDHGNRRLRPVAGPGQRLDLRDEERTRLTCADFYSAIKDAHESGQIQAARDYPLYFAALHSERPIVAPDARADPRTRELLGGGLAAAQARIEAPIFVAGRLAGVVRLEHEGSPRRFEHHEERFASSLADLAGLALEAQERRLKEAVARVGEERVRAQRDALAELSRSEALTRGQMRASSTR